MQVHELLIFMTAHNLFGYTTSQKLLVLISYQCLNIVGTCLEQEETSNNTKLYLKVLFIIVIVIKIFWSTLKKFVQPFEFSFIEGMFEDF